MAGRSAAWRILTVILLPPSEGKASSHPDDRRSDAGLATFSHDAMAWDLRVPRERARTALARAMRRRAADRQQLLGVKGAALALSTDANRSILTAPTMPAIERYTGVLYTELAVATLDAEARRRLDEQVVIMSGLWGALSPTDPIPDYRLKMGATIEGLVRGSPAKRTRLSAFWRPYLQALAAAQGWGERGLMWNLLPDEHAAAIDVTTMPSVTVRFCERRIVDGAEVFTAVSHWNKLLKGALVRWLVSTDDPTPQRLAAEFEHPRGYRHVPELDRVDGVHQHLVLAREADDTASTTLRPWATL